jgi:hypothetical protein
MVEESGMELEKLLKELRLMAAQPGYRFVLVWGLVLAQVVFRYLAIPVGVLFVSHRLGIF